MSDFRLQWEDAEEGDDAFAEIELLYAPRIGEKIWFDEKDGEKVVAQVTVLVEDVLHVVETADVYAYVELTVSLVERTILDEEDKLDERGCPCSIQGTITPEAREAIMQAAMADLRRKEQLLDADARLGKVQM